MDRKTELQEIESIIKNTEDFMKIDENYFFDYFRLTHIFKHWRNLDFFRFVPKTNRTNKKDFLEFATELKCLERSYNFKNYIFGISAFYFSIIFDSKPKYFGYKTTLKFLGISSIILYWNLVNKLDYFVIMRNVYLNDLRVLKEKIEKERNGWSNEVRK